MRRFRYEYGAGPAHLLAVAIAFAIVAYALSQMIGRGLVPFLIWVLLAAGLHDLVLFPLYAGSDRVAGVVARLVRDSAARPKPVRALNAVRFTVVFAALQLLVWFPLILGLGGLGRASGQPFDGYLERWIGLSLVIALLAALTYTVRWRRLSGPG